MKKLLIFSFFILVSCAGKKVEERPFDMQRRNIEVYGTQSSAITYFLPELPRWINFSSFGNCQRNYSIKYFDIKNLRDSYNFSYKDAIMLQMLYNRDAATLIKESPAGALGLKDEEILFYNVTEKIQSKIFPFKTPKYKVVNVVWIDPLLSNRSKLRSLMLSERLQSGHPVWVSDCLSVLEMQELLGISRLAGQNIRLISREAFTIFNEKNEKETFLSVDLNQFFRKDQKINLYTPSKVKRREIRGKYKIKTY